MSSPSPKKASSPPKQPRTALGAWTQMATQMVNQVQTRLGISKLKLRPGVQVPKIEVYDPTQPDDRKVEVYDLVGDRYVLGRSSRSADITLKSGVVSSVHGSFQRDRVRGGQFVFKDEKSTNGSYWRKRRIQALECRHGDRIMLGPPELENSVEIRYLDPPSRLVRYWRYGWYGLGGLTLMGALTLVWQWQQFSVGSLGLVQGPIAAYGGDGTPLQTLQSASHVELEQLGEFPLVLRQAVIASEDSRFYWHFGFDPVRILAAIWFTLQGKPEGGSTLTQQIARSLFPEYVGTDDSIQRKLKELVVATKLETFYSKDQLLLTYLNRIYLGVGYGFEDASQEYFGKSARDLTLPEAALLVGILPGPNLYNPCEDPDTARGLRNRIINRMVQLKMISEAEAQDSLRSPILIDPNVCDRASTLISPYFYGQVIAELDQLLGSEVVRQGNFIVETSLNLNMQTTAENALAEAIRVQGSQYGFSQGAIVTLDAHSGAILALVGGVDYQQSQFNRATQALRQPGSTFKIFAYTAALAQGTSPYQTYSCEGLTWEGQNFSPCERSTGTIDMYRGLAQSENAVALRVAQQVGLDKVVKLAEQMGIGESPKRLKLEAPLQAVPGLVLGQSEVTVLDITGAFGVLADEGIRHRPHAVNRVFDGNNCPNPAQYTTACRLAYDVNTDPAAAKRVLSPQVAATMTELLQGVVSSGTGYAANIPGAAGKTGTTNNAVDLWFVGYLPDRGWVTGIWLGNDDNTPTQGGSWLAAQLWADYMQQLLN